MEKTEYPRHLTWYRHEAYQIKERSFEKPEVDWWNYRPKTVDEWTDMLTYMNILVGDPTLENQTGKMKKWLEEEGLLQRNHASWPYHLTNKAKYLYKRAVSGDYPPMPT